MENSGNCCVASPGKAMQTVLSDNLGLHMRYDGSWLKSKAEWSSPTFHTWVKRQMQSLDVFNLALLVVWALVPWSF